MSGFSIVGTFETNLLQCKNFLESLYSEGDIKLIESNNVILCDYHQLSLNFEPYEYRDIDILEDTTLYMSAVFEGKYEQLKIIFLDKFVNALNTNSISYNFDIQEEDSEGNSLGDEINISLDKLT